MIGDRRQRYTVGRGMAGVTVKQVTSSTEGFWSAAAESGRLGIANQDSHHKEQKVVDDESLSGNWKQYSMCQGCGVETFEMRPPPEAGAAATAIFMQSVKDDASRISRSRGTWIREVLSAVVVGAVWVPSPAGSNSDMMVTLR